MAPWGSGFQLEGGIVLKKQTKATSTCDIFDNIDNYTTWGYIDKYMIY